MTTSRELRTKQKMLDVIERMPDDGTIDDAIYRLNLLKAVAEGLEAAEQGRVYDHEEVFDELLRDDAKNATGLDGAGKRRPARAAATHRSERAKKSPNVRRKVKGRSP
jgi:hypothetical protein